MSLPKIVIVGSGSASFGSNTLAAVIGSEQLRGCHLALVDVNAEALERVRRLAVRLNQEWAADMIITAHTRHEEALPAANFVVVTIEVPPREALWRSDYEIPLQFGVRQPYAENGGPGGFAHAARNIGPILAIARDMEQACPEAWLINYTNPMIRICDAISRYSSIRVVGLCHQLKVGYAMVGQALADDLEIEVPDGFITTEASPRAIKARNYVARQAMEKLEIVAAGINHFTWMLQLRDRATGEDMYSQFAERWKAQTESFEPLTRRMFSAFGVFPMPGDEHLSEYLPWVSDSATKPWEKYDLSLYEWTEWEGSRQEGWDAIDRMASGEAGVEDLRKADSEGALEVITNIARGGNHRHFAVNLPNRDYIGSLPQGSVVEVPGLITGAGVQGVRVGALPEVVAELCRRELTVVRLCVDAAVNGDRNAALQCLLLDPVIVDIDTAQNVLDAYLDAYREHLPQFWT